MNPKKVPKLTEEPEHYLLSFLQKKWLILLLTTLSVCSISLTLAMGVRQSAMTYAEESKVMPPGELPFLDSDNYKWSNWLKTQGFQDPSEATIDGKTPYIQWASLNKIYLKTLVWINQSLFSGFFSQYSNASQDLAKNYALFFSMPILTILGSILLCCYSLYILNDRVTALLLPLLLAALPALNSQFYPGRPDHHGMIVLAISLFILSLTKEKKPEGILNPTSPAKPTKPPSSKDKKLAGIDLKLGAISGVSSAIALWLGPLNFIPILGLVGITSLLTKFCPKLFATNLVLACPKFWKSWTLWLGSIATLGWLLDFLPRGTFHMESLNPVWILSSIAGGIFLSNALGGNEFAPQSPQSLRSKLKTLGLILVILLGPILCLNPKFFWTSSEPIIWFHREVFEMLPGKLDEIFSLFPLGFIALILVSLLPKMRAFTILAALASLLYLWQVRWLPLALLPTAIAGLRSIHLLGLKSLGTYHQENSEEGPATFTLNSNDALKTVLLATLIIQTAWATTFTVREGMDNWNYPRSMPETYRIPAFVSLASKILKGMPPGYIVGSPNLTTYFTHFSGRRGVGSVYWEAKDNMALAAKIITSLPNEDKKTLELIRKHNISYIAITPQVPCASYYGLENKRKQMRETLEARLLRGENPPWVKTLINIPEPWPGILLAKIELGNDKTPLIPDRNSQTQQPFSENTPLSLNPNPTGF